MRFSLASVALLAVAGVVLTSVPADAVTEDGHGADVSWPQCGAALPTGASFGVVGVNTGVGNETNPCLASELDWAAATTGEGQQTTAVYVMSQDPGHLGRWWPASAQTEGPDPVLVDVPAAYGPCTTADGSLQGEESAACAYVYGYDMALGDLGRVAQPTAYRWWIDVETSNTWALSPTANRADIEGMAAAFKAAEVGVGLYSTAYQWGAITGVTPPTSPLVGLPSWIAGTGDVTSAEAGCYLSALTPGGGVELAQYQTETRGTVSDEDLACHRLTGTPTPTVTGSAAVDQLLTAHAGVWAPSPVTLRYQWNRDSKPISHATGSTYRTSSADAGHAVTVTVTGSRSGWTTRSRTSASIRVAVPLSRLTEPHTLATGHSLLAPNGRYRLTQRTDGDLVLYKDTGAVLWSSHRYGKGYSTTMQRDGNLVTYSAGHRAVWATGTDGDHATSLVVQSDGNVVLYTTKGTAVWATRTNGR